jgi:hypothetical protein
MQIFHVNTFQTKAYDTGSQIEVTLLPEDTRQCLGTFVVVMTGVLLA